MAMADIQPGVCGLATTVEAGFSDDTGIVALGIESECEGVRRLAAELNDVDGYQAAMTPAPKNPVYLAAGQARMHAACPVPCGIIKAIEVACSLALPKDVSVKVSR